MLRISYHQLTPTKDPDSKVANVLLGVYHLSLTSNISEDDQDFITHYKKAMNEYVQRSYKKDKTLALACTMFASYFFSAGGWANVEMLGKKAIEYSDVGQISSEAYYLMGRKHQQSGEYDLARQCYVRSEGAREDGSFLPAKLGSGQIQILNKGKHKYLILLTLHPADDYVGRFHWCKIHL